MLSVRIWVKTFGEHERSVKATRGNSSFLRVLSELAKGQCYVKTQIYLFI